MRFFWLAEHPTIPLYRLAKPTSGKLGERQELTADANLALQFASRDECQAWIAGQSLTYVAREHGMLTTMHVDEKCSQ